MPSTVTCCSPSRQPVDPPRQILVKHACVRRITAPQSHLHPRVLPIASGSPLVAVPRASQRRVCCSLWAVVLVAADHEIVRSTVLRTACVRRHRRADLKPHSIPNHLSARHNPSRVCVPVAAPRPRLDHHVRHALAVQSVIRLPLAVERDEAIRHSHLRVVLRHRASSNCGSAARSAVLLSCSSVALNRAPAHISVVARVGEACMRTYEQFGISERTHAVSKGHVERCAVSPATATRTRACYAPIVTT